MSALLETLKDITGEAYVLTGADTTKWSHDWIGMYEWAPLAVVRPASTEQVSAVAAACHSAGVAMVPVSGNTGLAGGTRAQDAVMISLDRMNKIKDIAPEARVAVVEAGVALADLHTATDACGLAFPLTFGARGSAMIGGCLATNAGGSNVVRYGNTRDLCLGLEVVLADGRVMNLMGALHKDNSGLNLKHLFIGAEGTLGLITGAVLKLVERPTAYATAMLALPSLAEGLTLLNTLQANTSGGVEAFEYMPASYMQAHAEVFPDARPAFDQIYEVCVMVEVASAAPRDTTAGEDGEIPLVTQLEETLGGMLETGALLDATVAKNEAQRAEIWARREAAAEVTLHRQNIVNMDVAVPLDDVAIFLQTADAQVRALDPEADILVVSHLGDGNVHYTVCASRGDPDHKDQIMQVVEQVVSDLSGSFSAEHGIGTTKLPSMARLKDPVAMDVMRQIKQALDPKNLMNPGKVLPPAEEGAVG